MAISLIGQPADQSPAYNNIYWYFDSTNKNKLGFRYVVDIYRRTGPTTQILIKRLRIPPAIGTGFCVAEISKTLQTFLTNQSPATTLGVAGDSYLRYNVRVGEEFENPWRYSDYEFYGAPTGGLDPWNAYTILTSTPVGGGGTNQTHNFVVGDTIVVEQVDGGALKPVLQGLHTVVKVLSNTSIVIDIPFSVVGSGAAVAGDVTYANGQKTIFPNLLSILDKGAFNAAYSHIDWRTYTDTVIEPSVNTALLSDIPQEFSVTDNTALLLNAYRGTTTLAASIEFVNSLGVVRRATVPGGAKDYFYFGAGPANLPATVLIAAPLGVPSFDIIQPGIQYYDVFLVNEFGVRLSLLYRFYYKTTCTKYPIQSIRFLDRKGSLGGFDFTFSSRETAAIERSQNRGLIGGLSGGKFQYTTNEAENRVLNVNLTESIELNTAWLSQGESDYFQQLLSTPVAYMRLDGTNWWPVIVEETASERKDLTNNKNIRYTVRVKLANTNSINW